MQQHAVDLWHRELRQTGVRAGLPGAVAVLIGAVPWLFDWVTLAQPAGIQGGLRALGIIAGGAGAALWVMSLLLMLRFRALDRHFGGLEAQYFAHHVTGTWSYLMLLAHPLLLVAAAWQASSAAAAQLAAPWMQPWGVVAGWLALIGLMVMMFATFFSGLPYAQWRRLHAASGVAYGFALLHVIALVPAAGAGRGAALLLIVLMAGGIVILGVRHLLDRGALGARTFRVERVERSSPTTVQIRLAPLAGDPPLAHAPGQFVFVAFDSAPGYAGCHEYHPFTISSAPGSTTFKVLVKALGDCTARMQQLVAGATARVQGPYGGLFRHANFSRAQLWLGGGIGITPFLSMAAALPANAASVDLYYLARDASEAFGLAELRAIAARHPNLRVFAFVANEDPHTVHAAVESASAPLAGREVYVCGPPGMLQDALQWLRQVGVPDAHIHAERFDFR